MSCGTGRINRGIKPKTQHEREWNARRALNTPAVYNTITREELEEVEEYLGLREESDE